MLLPIGPRLLHIGRVYLERCEPLAAAADPHGSVSPPSRLLCAALSALGLEAYRALGGQRHVTAVGTAAAMLALLTKIDDQVIDSAAFHGGMNSEPETVATRVRAHLAPTLASVRAGAPATPEPRCLLGAAPIGNDEPQTPPDGHLTILSCTPSAATAGGRSGAVRVGRGRGARPGGFGLRRPLEVPAGRGDEGAHLCLIGSNLKHSFTSGA